MANARVPPRFLLGVKMKSIIVTRSDDLLKISVPGRIWDQIDFHVDVSYTIDDYDVAETVEEWASIEWLKVYDKYKKPAFRWNKKVTHWLQDEIEYFLTKEFKGGNHDITDAN